VASSSRTLRREAQQARSSRWVQERRGEDGKIVALELKRGDRVLFGKWSGTEVKIDGAELLIMKESDVMGVLST
jgi:co-chaperonin GroES (HSP10)